MTARIKKLSDSTDELKSKSEHMTVDYITVLGVFTSITFATFGGLQLLGNVFGNIRNTAHTTVGREIMLGAIFLFGTYAILVALLTGVSKIVGKDYNLSKHNTMFTLAGITLIFLIGILYTNTEWANPMLEVFGKFPAVLFGFIVILFIAVVVWLMCTVLHQQDK